MTTINNQNDRILYNPADFLPTDVFKGEILAKLDPQSLSRCCQVSKEWNACASDDRLWKKFFDGSWLHVPQTNIKKFIAQHAVLSVKELAARYQKLLHQLQPGITIHFIGVFPCNDPSSYQLHKQVGVGTESKADEWNGFPGTNVEKTIYDRVIFLQKLPEDDPYADSPVNIKNLNNSFLSYSDSDDLYFNELNIQGKNHAVTSSLSQAVTTGTTKMMNKAISLQLQQTQGMHEKKRQTAIVKNIVYAALTILIGAGIKLYFFE